MKKTLFDKIFLSSLVIVVLCFSLLLGYTSYATKQSFINEKQDTLKSEATMIAKQYITSYLNSTYTADTLQDKFDIISTMLNVDLIYTDSEGRIIAISTLNEYEDMPLNIYDLDKDFQIEKSITMTGNFYSKSKEKVATTGIPIINKDTSELQGYILISSSLAELNTINSKMLGNTYMAFFGMILISFILISFVSKRILIPLDKINTAAREYASGNFDYKLQVNTKDEIGQLANSLEYMASELSKLDEYRRNFIANISHDFRSPLTSIKGYVEAMLDGTIPVELQEKYLNIVLFESKRLTKLTSSLLTLENLDSYGPVIKKSNFDLISIIKSTTQTFEGTANKKEIELVINSYADKCEVNADKSKIQQVLYNLIDNAIKFSNVDSKITIKVSDMNDKISISVKDSGAGISRDGQKKIWDRFYKSDSSRGKDKQGTGLGLSITKEIIKAHNENINVISTEGVGSEFIFTLKKTQKNIQSE